MKGDRVDERNMEKDGERMEKEKGRDRKKNIFFFGIVIFIFR
jgi:predicted nucleic acid-binding Zn ribbon protein